MKIESKYNIGDRIWEIYENRGEVCVYDDIIAEIVVDEDGIAYIVERACIDVKEDEIVLYADKESLVNKIIETMNEIHRKEKEERIMSKTDIEEDIKICKETIGNFRSKT